MWSIEMLSPKPGLWTYTNPEIKSNTCSCVKQIKTIFTCGTEVIPPALNRIDSDYCPFLCVLVARKIKKIVSLRQILYHLTPAVSRDLKDLLLSQKPALLSKRAAIYVGSRTVVTPHKWRLLSELLWYMNINSLVLICGLCGAQSAAT